MLKLIRAVISRDLRLAMRRQADIVAAMFFFIIVVSLFPLGVGPEPDQLRKLAPGVLWVAALLATMLSLPRLFADDHRDGSLEQLALAPQPLGLIVIGKIVAHWLVAGLPLVVLAPVLGIQFDLAGDALAVLTLSLLIGTPALSGIGAIGAALTLGVRGGGVLLSLLVLPLYIPVLIFRRRRGRRDGDRTRRAGPSVAARRAGAGRRVFCAVAHCRGPENCPGIDEQPSNQLVQVRQSADLLPARGQTDTLVLDPGSNLRRRRADGRFPAGTDRRAAGGRLSDHLLHVPASWMSMFIYLVMAFWAAPGWLSTPACRA
jgi:heme exporter protein B